MTIGWARSSFTLPAKASKPGSLSLWIPAVVRTCPSPPTTCAAFTTVCEHLRQSTGVLDSFAYSASTGATSTALGVLCRASVMCIPCPPGDTARAPCAVGGLPHLRSSPRGTRHFSDLTTPRGPTTVRPSLDAQVDGLQVFSLRCSLARATVVPSLRDRLPSHPEFGLMEMHPFRGRSSCQANPTSPNAIGVLVVSSALALPPAAGANACTHMTKTLPFSCRRTLLVECKRCCHG